MSAQNYQLGPVRDEEGVTYALVASITLSSGSATDQQIIGKVPDWARAIVGMFADTAMQVLLKEDGAILPRNGSVGATGKNLLAANTWLPCSIPLRPGGRLALDVSGSSGTPSVQFAIAGTIPA